MPSELDNYPWHALNTTHAHLAICAGAARKYPADIAPFAGTADRSPASMLQLLSLLETEETTYVLGDPPVLVAGMAAGEPYPVLQMIAEPRRLWISPSRKPTHPSFAYPPPKPATWSISPRLPFPASFEDALT